MKEYQCDPKENDEIKIYAPNPDIYYIYMHIQYPLQINTYIAYHMIYHALQCIGYISHIRWYAHYSQIECFIEVLFLFIIIKQYRLVVCTQDLKSGSLSDLKVSYSTSRSLSFACLLTDWFLTLTLLCGTETDPCKHCLPGWHVNWLQLDWLLGGSRRTLEDWRKQETRMCLPVSGQVSSSGRVSSDYSFAPPPWLLTSDNMASSLDLSGPRDMNNLLPLIMSGLSYHPSFPIAHSNSFITCTPYCISSVEPAVDCVY